MTTTIPSQVVVRRVGDHRSIDSPFCGRLIEVLQDTRHHESIAVMVDILPTIPHFHQKLEETYFMLDGAIRLALYDPGTVQFHEFDLAANELCVIPPGVHHRVVTASERNRLCVLCTPAFDRSDEHPSTAWDSSAA